MKQLFNYCIIPGYESEILKSGKNLKDYIASLNLDGVEWMVYDARTYPEADDAFAVGAHLNYCPMWWDFYHQQADRYSAFFHTEAELQAYFGAANVSDWLNVIRKNLQAAVLKNPEYVVWHVAECTPVEAYTFKFNHTDMEIVNVAADIFNEVGSQIPENITVLFENLWWPGLRLTDPAVVDCFFNRIQRDNVGIMLDTGHLMNTNLKLRTQAEAAAYICSVVEDLGSLKELLRGIHLNCSLSGDYVQSVMNSGKQDLSAKGLLEHIVAIDRHQPFTDSVIQQVIEMVRPDYLVHELAYQSFLDLHNSISQQMQTINRGNKN